MSRVILLLCFAVTAGQAGYTGPPTDLFTLDTDPPGSSTAVPDTFTTTEIDSLPTTDLDIPTFRTTEVATEEVTDPPEPKTEKVTGPYTTEPTQLPLELRQPKIKVHPRNVTVPEDSFAKFFCSATGSPSPHLVIVRSDSNYKLPIFEKNPRQKGEESLPEVQQTIGPITRANEGWYECIAANYWGSVKSWAYLRVMDLCNDVECTAPKICAQNYDTATAECQCPELLCAGDRYEPVCGGDCEVHFNPCVWNQTSCTNDYDSSTVLNVGSCPETTQPEVELFGEDLEIEEGGSFSLRAAVEGWPVPSIEWQKVDNEGNFIQTIAKGLDLVLSAVTLDMSGRYIARATNCQTRHSYTRSVRLDVTPTPPTEPSVEEEVVYVCSTFGDPHIMTFDNHAMHFGGACTYLLGMDCEHYNWIMYGLYTYCGVGTCLEEVTIFIKYKPFVLLRGWIILVETKKHQFIEGKDFEVAGMKWTFDGMVLRGRNDELGLSIAWDGLTSFQVGLDESTSHHVCGVCGNNDRSSDNEHLQWTMLEERLVPDPRANIYVDNWKIDREKACVLPDDVTFDTNEPCGTDYGKSRAAKNACQVLVENPALKRCTHRVDLKFYYESCLYDYCFMGLLREPEDPFAAPAPSISPQCNVARSYVAHCEMAGVSMRGWDVYMTCDKEGAQDAIVSESNYQENLPFIRFKK